MSKVRVYEVARELGLPNHELVPKIQSMGIHVRNHMSVLDPLDVDRVKRQLKRERTENVVEERIRPTVVRRRVARKKPKEEPKEEPKVAAAPVVRREPSSSVYTAPAPVTRERAPEPVASPVSNEVAPPPPEVVEPVAAAPEPEPVAAPPVAAAEPEVAAAPVDATPAEEPPAPVADAPAEEVAAAPEPVAKPEPEVDPTTANAIGRRAAGVSRAGYRPTASEPPPASERLKGPILPPGVTRRGNTSVAPVQLSQEARARIVQEHERRNPPRRREVGPGSLRNTGRNHGRPGKKKMASGKKGKSTVITVPGAQKRIIRIEDQITLQQLAQRMSLKATQVLMQLMQMGMTGVHINSTLDVDTAKILASEFNYEVENVARSDDELVGDARGEFIDNDTDRQTRAPVVTVMGHVDHGKTSLLDKIRKADVASREAGGITQHIGAYRVDTKKGPVVFLDTPGHAAFTAMRARGATVTDISILVVAADDGVMPQTRESINHAKAAGVPVIVAINKMDLPDANPDKVKTALASEGLQPEEWGGDTICVEVSAHTGDGIDTLLESLVLQAEMLELSCNPNVPAEGIVLEAYLDRGRGPVANVLVKNGTLSPGDIVVAGRGYGRVRALTDQRKKRAKTAGPATPVEVLGLSEIPSAGDTLYAVTDMKKAQFVAESRRPAGDNTSMPSFNLEDIKKQMAMGDVEEVKLVVKADMQGSLEALKKSLAELSHEKVRVNVIHTGVGGITESDVNLASTSEAIIIGFNVRPAGQAGATAKKENVDVRSYRVIYEAIDDVKLAMAGKLSPTFVAKETGKAEIREIFVIPKIGAIAGCMVTEGKIFRNGKGRLVRDSNIIWEGDLASLRRFKDTVKEVAAGYECGIGLTNFSDLREGDIIEAYELEEVAATLDD